jgi:arylsulfatase A-like enzyme
LVPLLDGKMKVRPKAIGFWQFSGNKTDVTTNSGPSAWNDQQYKLVKPKPDVWELYDIAADRTEKQNIATEKPEIVARMKAELEAWQQSVIRSYHGEDYTKK